MNTSKTVVFVTTMIAAVYIAVRSNRDPHREARDEEYELWTSFNERTAPGPSTFTAWRRAYGRRALRKAIIDSAAINTLAPALVNRVLYMRAQAAYVSVEAA